VQSFGGFQGVRVQAEDRGRRRGARLRKTGLGGWGLEDCGDGVWRQERAAIVFAESEMGGGAGEERGCANEQELCGRFVNKRAPADTHTQAHLEPPCASR
jgi:hypothetical protein